MVFLMYLARYTLPPAFSIHIAGLFASVYLLVIKAKPFRGSRKSHFSLLQEPLRLAKLSLLASALPRHPQGQRLSLYHS